MTLPFLRYSLDDVSQDKMKTVENHIRNACFNAINADGVIVQHDGDLQVRENNAKENECISAQEEASGMNPPKTN